MARAKREPIRHYGPGVDPRTGYVIPPWLDPRVWDAAIRQQKKFTLMELLGLYAIEPSEADIVLRSARSNLAKQMSERGEWAAWGIPKFRSLPEAVEGIAEAQAMELRDAERLLREVLAWRVFHVPGKPTERGSSELVQYDEFLRALYDIDPLFVWRCLGSQAEDCAGRITNGYSREWWISHLRRLRSWLGAPAGPLPSPGDRPLFVWDDPEYRNDVRQEAIAGVLYEMTQSLREIASQSGNMRAYSPNAKFWDMVSSGSRLRDVRLSSMSAMISFRDRYVGLLVDEVFRLEIPRRAPGVRLDERLMYQTSPLRGDWEFSGEVRLRVERASMAEFAGQLRSQPFTHLEAFHRVATDGWNEYFRLVRESRRGE